MANIQYFVYNTSVALSANVYQVIRWGSCKLANLSAQAYETNDVAVQNSTGQEFLDYTLDLQSGASLITVSTYNTSTLAFATATATYTSLGYIGDYDSTKYPAQADDLDTTGNQLLRYVGSVGSFGLGAKSNSDFNPNATGIPTRFGHTIATNSPDGANPWHMIHISKNLDQASGQFAIADLANTAGPKAAVRHRGGGGLWSAWNILFGSLNLPAYTDVTGLGALATLSSVDSAQITNLAVSTPKVALNAITNARLAQMPLFSIKLNNTAATADPIDGTIAQFKTMVVYDLSTADVTGVLPAAKGGTGQNSLPLALGALFGYVTTVTSVTTVVLSATSPANQVFTGTVAQTVSVPTAANVVPGFAYWIVNNSTAALSVVSSTAAAICTINAGEAYEVICNQASGGGANAWTAVRTTINQAAEIITGGSINGTPIGATTPSTGAFTTLSSTGDQVVKSVTPTSKSAAATLTLAELQTGIIQYTGVAAALTMPLGTALDAMTQLIVGTALEFSIINTGSGAATVTANTGVTLVGAAAVAIATSAQWRLRKTATSTYIAYRL